MDYVELEKSVESLYGSVLAKSYKSETHGLLARCYIDIIASMRILKLAEKYPDIQEVSAMYGYCSEKVVCSDMINKNAEAYMSHKHISSMCSNMSHVVVSVYETCDYGPVVFANPPQVCIGKIDEESGVFTKSETLDEILENSSYCDEIKTRINNLVKYYEDKKETCQND